MRTKKQFGLIIIIAVVLLFSGCASAPTKKSVADMKAAGQYQDAVNYIEENFTYEKADLTTLFYLCSIYLDLANYNKFFECSEIYIKRINALKDDPNGPYRKQNTGVKAGHFVASMLLPMPPLKTVVSYERRMSTMLTLSAFAHIDLGDNYQALQDAEESMKFVEAVKGIDPIPNYVAAGLACAIMGHRSEAEEYIQKIDAYRRKKYGVIVVAEDEISKFRYKGMTEIYIALRDYDEAKKVIERKSGKHISEHLMNVFFTAASFYGSTESGVLSVADTLISETTKKSGWGVAQDLRKSFLLAKIAYETGALDDAKKGYDVLLEQPVVKNFGNINSIILHDRGVIALKEGDSEKAIKLFKQSVEVIELQRSTINTEASKIGFVGNKQAVYHDLVAVLVEMGQHGEAFAYAERSKARALVDMLASIEKFSSGEKGGSTQIVSLLNDLDKAERESLTVGNRTSPEQYAGTHNVMLKQKQKISQTAPELSSLVTVIPPDVAEIQQLLPPEETLVEYFGMEDTLFAFIVTKDEVRGVKLEIKELNKKISAFREQIMPGDRPIYMPEFINQIKKDGQTLYEELFRPLESMISTENLSIVPHGALHYLPFNALCSEEGFLIDRYNIRILPSASLMKFLKDKREGHVGTLLAFGNPELSDQRFVNLPGAEDEVIAITSDQPDSKLLLRKEATETALIRFGEQYRYIHFATHGIFDTEKPLSSHLLLAGDSENDGTLTVRELYNLRLNSDMVILSACETALGRVANGDDVVGFSRGFTYAGVSSIVSSLWAVEDKATSMLMQQFYKHLKEQDNRSALRAAQRMVKDEYNAHPFFWAAFQLTGAIQ
jgi:CHAT domain-containing protein